MSPPPFPTKRMLGIDFFVGTPAEAVAYISRHGGLVVAPAAPSFIALQDDPDYRRAIADADFAIADSGWAVLFWRLLRREKLTRISGLALFKALLETADARIPKNLFWILPTEKAKSKTLAFSHTSGYPITADDCYVAPRYSVEQALSPSGRRLRGGSPPAEPINAGKRERLPYIPDLLSEPSALPSQRPSSLRAVGSSEPEAISHLASTASPPMVEDPNLVSIIEQRKPKHIIIGIGGGMQDKLGSYLKHQLSYRPGIYCIGAAPGFVTGDQVTIPMWADRLFVGWIFRIMAHPRTYLARYWRARLVAFLISKYGKEMPPLLA